VICKGNTKTRKNSVHLISWLDSNLKESIIALQVIKVRVEMILPSGCIQLSVINAHAPPSDSLSRNKFILFISNDSYAPFFGS